MKKVMSLLLAFSFIFGFCQFIVYADTSGEQINWSSSEKRKLYIGNSIVYLADFKISEPIEAINEAGEKEYHKKVRVDGGYFITGSNEKILSSNLEFDFKFDGRTSDITSRDINKEITRENNKWKLTASEEILKSPSQCIVSEKMLIGKKKKNRIRKKYREIDNFHIDTMCSKDGEISFNLKSLTKIPERKYDIIMVSDNSVELENGVTRQVVEKNKVFKYNETTNSDNYNYITRKIEISYLDEEGAVIARAFIDANFRYNQETKDVQCISTTQSGRYLGEDGEIEVNARTGNETKSYGGAYAFIKVEHSEGLMKDVYEDTILISCDYHGNIISRVVF